MTKTFLIQLLILSSASLGHIGRFVKKKNVLLALMQKNYQGLSLLYIKKEIKSIMTDMRLDEVFFISLEVFVTG